MYAIKILTKQHPNETICLWIVGGDISEDSSHWPRTLRELSKLQKTLSLATSIRFVGRQKQTELPYYYNAADVVVMPSHYESFGLSALEAIGCGVPVITTNVAGISRLISNEYAPYIAASITRFSWHLKFRKYLPPAFRYRNRHRCFRTPVVQCGRPYAFGV